MPFTRDRLYVWYFVFHVFITWLIDSAIVLPDRFLSQVQRQLLEFHVRQNSDLLVQTKPIWLQAFVWVELLLQTPFFIWAALDLTAGRTRIWPAILVYAVEASTTTLACLVECALLPLTLDQRINLVMIYLPTFVVPFILLVDFWSRIQSRLTKAKQE